MTAEDVATETRPATAVAAAAAFLACVVLTGCDGAGDRSVARSSVRNPERMPALEKAMRDVPPLLRSSHQKALTCNRIRAESAGRRYAVTPDEVRRLATALRTEPSLAQCPELTAKAERPSAPVDGEDGERNPAEGR